MLGADDSFSTGYPPGFPFDDLNVEVKSVSYENGAPTSLYRIAIVKVIIGSPF
jgi:hypothetical protein